jgi:carboxyl-terminal processing protease
LKDDKTKTFAELEKETREKSLDEYFGFMNDLDRDWFSVYINSITSVTTLTQIILHLKKRTF